MAKCEVCSNEYDKSFDLTMHDGSRHTFDSFECAIQACAPSCSHCHCKVIGHGVEANDRIYCCSNCARMVGIKDLNDRVA